MDAARLEDQPWLGLTARARDFEPEGGTGRVAEQVDTAEGPAAWLSRDGVHCGTTKEYQSERGRGEIGRRSRLQLECPRGNPWSRTAQSRGKLRARPKPIPSQAPPGEGVETRRAAPTVERLWRRDSPDHERRSGGGESRGGTKICFSKGNAGSSPAVRTIPRTYMASTQNPLLIMSPGCANDTHDLAQRLSYSSWRRHQTPVSLRPLGARSSHWYMPQRPSSPRA
jgi:hypothetical protein